jgi:hypothetical protein
MPESRVESKLTVHWILGRKKDWLSGTTLDLVVDLISHMLYFCYLYALAADGASQHQATQLDNPLRVHRSGSRDEQFQTFDMPSDNGFVSPAKDPARLCLV